MKTRYNSQSKGKCIANICFINLSMIIVNLIMPLPTGLGPSLVAIVFFDIIAFSIIALRNNNSGNSRSYQKKIQMNDYNENNAIESNPNNFPIEKSEYRCPNCNAPIEANQEFCNQCGNKLK